MTSKGQTICLCMIVKDEAHVIRRCLASVRPLIDHWLIADTGSTDGTQGIIRETMADLPGELVERPWVDFGHNRTEALALSRPRADYTLIIDADDELALSPGFVMPDLSSDSYSIDIHYGAVTYRRPQVVRNSLEWSYRGVLHEFLHCAEAKTAGHLPIVMKINHEGRRSTDGATYARDAAILEAALATETDPFLVSRYTFYLAQSYRDAGAGEQALAAYLRRADLGFWDQEIFVSLLHAGRLMEGLGRDPDDVIATYRRASEACPSRAEAAHAASRFCRGLDRFAEGHAIAKGAIALAAPADGLFVETWIYDYGLRDELAVNGYWSGHYRDCLDATLRALETGKVPADSQPRFLQNMRFALDKMAEGVEADDPAAVGVARTADAGRLDSARTNDRSGIVRVHTSQYRIYRTIHIIWVGDETKRPDDCIETWREMNPAWDVRIWGNDDLESETWRNRAHIERMMGRELNGVADMMRWEILERHGGFAVDADSVCVRPLADWLFETEIFASWENEIVRPGLIACGFVYAHPGNTLIRQVIRDIEDVPDVTSDRAWITVGPRRLTDTVHRMGYAGLTIYPSHFFLPDHFTGARHAGRGVVFANHYWEAHFRTCTAGRYRKNNVPSGR